MDKFYGKNKQFIFARGSMPQYKNADMIFSYIHVNDLKPMDKSPIHEYKTWNYCGKVPSVESIRFSRDLCKINAAHICYKDENISEDEMFSRCSGCRCCNYVFKHKEDLALEFEEELEMRVHQKTDDIREIMNEFVYDMAIEFTCALARKFGIEIDNERKAFIEPNNLFYSECYVYFARAGKLVKIGMSANPEARLQQLKIGNGKDITIIGTILTDNRDDARELEKNAHNHFEPHWVRGEWFEVSDEEIFEFIKRHQD